ncbi:MAG TPA: aminotransferase class V-fold PLP-dependent enzyme [Bryobacteraceae bacterium]|nr:aminotransferase class V-fold PLP-dependent enzyme [Bryobacteraceae bacterium]
MDELLAWRKEFPILETTVHMISHSLGAMPRRAYERIEEYAETWSKRGIRAWEEGWWEMPVRVGDLVGRIIGAGPGEVVMQQNVSSAVATVLSCFVWSGRRHKIVSEAFNFPSNLYQCHALEKLGARVETVASEDGIGVPLERMLAAIDGETQLVFVSHVLFRSSFIQNLAAITRRAHEMGAMVLADIYQSAGTIPIDVRALGLDFATGGSVKWLCGGPGAGYLYVRRDLWPKLEPRVTGWMAHKRPFAFEAGPIDYADDAFRFLNGTPGIPALYAARSGYEIIAEVGVDRIRQKSVRQTARLVELAEAAGFRVNSPRDPAQRGGTVVIDVPNGAEVTRELLRRNFLVDHRPDAGIRVAPHFYSTDEELELTIREMQAIVQKMPAATGAD